MEVIPVEELMASLSDPDSSPFVLQKKLTSLIWESYSAADRRRLRPILLAHADQLVREHAGWCLAAWGEAEGLLALLDDVDYTVRKTAMYCLSELPPDVTVAERAWQLLFRPGTLGVHATETLHTFVHHSEPGTAVPRLVEIAMDHTEREALRTVAVQHLVRLGATAAVRQMGGFLDQPPAVTWAFHIGLLYAFAEPALPKPDLEPLREVDNLDVQAAVAHLDASRSGER
jgi:hypothetical protein